MLDEFRILDNCQRELKGTKLSELEKLYLDICILHMKKILLKNEEGSLIGLVISVENELKEVTERINNFSRISENDNKAKNRIMRLQSLLEIIDALGTE